MRKIIILTMLLLFTLSTTSAQDILQLNQLTSGELTQTSPTASYFIALKSGQELHLQAVAATSGLTLQATLSTAAGTLIQSIPNVNNSPTLDADLNANTDGIFRLDLFSVNASNGQFVLLVQEITPVEPDAALAIDEPTDDTIQPGESIVYALSGILESRLILSVTTTDPQDSLDVQLLSATGAVVASFETQQNGSELLIPARRADYQLKLDNSQQTAVRYQITLEALDGLISTPVSSPTSLATTAATPAATESSICTVTPLNIAVNVRRGPSTRFDAFMSLQPGASLTAIARNSEGTWYQVQANSVSLGWVAASVVSAAGSCSSLQAVFIPTPTLSPATSTPTTEPTSASAARCAPYQFYHAEDNGAYMTISLPAASVNTVINYLDGYHTQYVFPTCRAILWTSLTFTCESNYSGGPPYWTLSQFGRFDWNATCGSNTNVNQSGLSFGVLP